jgi:hypothetical protein
LTDLLAHDRSPLGSSKPTTVLEPSIQRHLTHFSLITHGFGSPAIVAVLNSFQNYLSEMLKYYEKTFSSNSSSNNSSSSTSNSGMNNLVGLSSQLNEHTNGYNLLAGSFLNTNSAHQQLHQQQHQQQQQHHYHHSMQNEQLIKISDNSNSNKKDEVIEKAR